MEEGLDDVKSAWPLWFGLHTYYNGYYNWLQCRETEPILKSNPSSDCSLQLDYMKVESLVIVNQNVTVNRYLSLVHTARHTMGIGYFLTFLKFYFFIGSRAFIILNLFFYKRFLVTGVKS